MFFCCVLWPFCCVSVLLLILITEYNFQHEYERQLPLVGAGLPEEGKWNAGQLRATCFSRQRTQCTLFIKMSLLRSSAFRHPTKCERGMGCGNRNTAQFPGSTQKRMKLLVEQSWNQVNGCLNFKGGSKLLISPGLEIILTYESQYHIKVKVQKVRVYTGKDRLSSAINYQWDLLTVPQCQSVQNKMIWFSSCPLCPRSFLFDHQHISVRETL